MPSRRQAWAAMGLVLTWNPRLGAWLRPGEVQPEGLLAGSAKALQTRLGLRKKDATAILNSAAA